MYFDQVIMFCPILSPFMFTENVNLGSTKGRLFVA